MRETNRFGVWRITVLMLLVGVMVMLMSPMAMAVTAPVAGSFAYDVYDIGVNGILKGPIGFMSGVGAIAFGAFMAIRGQIMLAIPAILGGAFLLKADSVVESLGAMI